MIQNNRLPIDEVLPALREALRRSANAVLTAEPGAGKTTRVPLALLDEPWLKGRRIVMLEPRRLAARAAARFMAASLGEQVGETIGYRVKMDTMVGPRTRIEVVTEGVLTRMLQQDPALESVGLVIFDEFHERSLNADLGLALCLESQAVLRDDLRLLVMSATLEAGPVAELLQEAPVLSSKGRAFPVETRYTGRGRNERLEAAVVRTIAEAMNEEPEGDLLVFLPGTGEIRRVEALLGGLRLGAGVHIAPLHSGLPQELQDRAIAPAKAGQRKIVLATSIAETSLTVEGVRVVVDSGLMRIPRFSPRTGMTRLETVPAAIASADQRRGRAGRLGPGVCYRIWDEAYNAQLPRQRAPEIMEADLAPLVLELAAWGTADPANLRWLDQPPAAAFNQARQLLCRLGALDEAGRITGHGRAMARLGTQPRLAHMLLRAAALGHGRLACQLAALLGDRNILRSVQGGGSFTDVDVRLRVEALQAARLSAGSVVRIQGAEADMNVCRRLLAEADSLYRELEAAAEGQDAQRKTSKAQFGSLPPEEPAAAVTGKDQNIDSVGLLLALAYPDRIAQRRGNGGFLLQNGRGAVIPQLQPLSGSPYLVAAELDDQGPDSRIFLAAPITPEELKRHADHLIQLDTIVTWDAAVQAVRARKQLRLGALLLEDKPQQLSEVDPDEVCRALLSGIAAEGIGLLPWTRGSRQLQERLQFLSKHDSGWPDVSDEALLSTMDQWLRPQILGLKNRQDLQRLQMNQLLEDRLNWEQRRQLDELAPTAIRVPSGSRIAVDYSDPSGPVLAVRLQELFGMSETPRIAGGRVPITLHLLSPAQRPVQVTRDLANFWRSTYFEVKKDLKGRYPKHYWPEDPLIAEPTSRVRPKG
ncbi:ATP-dependent helicase HrpB [Paenibacillus sp. y28]|uniref:ATP-dependent helicase HrpB n=1 Tax=Paenibacillus sp. y28 TaxID=3129110 RepID=UPI003015B7AF